MNKIEQLLQQLCPDGVEWKELGEVGYFVRGNGMPKSDFTESGIGCIHYGQIYTYYGIFTDKTKSFVSQESAKKLQKVQKNDLIITNTSENIEDVCKTVVWLGEDEIVTGGHASIFKHNENPKYLAYYFQTEMFFVQKKKLAKGTKVIDVSAKDLAKVIIPIPPIAIQQEIVNILDKFTQLQAELQAELQARRAQYEYYRNELLNFEGKEVEWKIIQNVCLNIFSGGTPYTSRTDYYGGDIPWLRTQEVDWIDIYDTSIKITKEGLKNSSAKLIPSNCVIVAMYGATAAKVAINKIPLCTNQACCNLEIDEEQANYKYVFYWLCNEYKNLKALGEGSQSNINGQKVKNYSIPIPPLSEQNRIVAILDKFDKLVNDISVGLPAEIEARRKQYEYYRGRLLEFKCLNR